jgi:flagellar biosynthesis protein FlhG
MRTSPASIIRRVSGSRVMVVAVASGKGGVGKTCVSVNLAVTLAAMKRKVWLLDTDLGLANVDVMLGMKPARNLSHVISGECSIEDIVVQGPHGLGVIPSASGLRNLAKLGIQEQAGLIWALSDFGHDIDALVVDLASGISDNVLSFARACQEIIIVVCDEPASLTDAYALIKVMANEFGVRNFHMLANMCQGLDAGSRLYDKLARVTDRFLDIQLDFAGTIPYDPYMLRAIQMQMAVVDRFPASSSTKAFKKLARLADNWSAGYAASGDLQFFLERMLDTDTLRSQVSS